MQRCPCRRCPSRQCPTCWKTSPSTIHECRNFRCSCAFRMEISQAQLLLTQAQGNPDRNNQVHAPMEGGLKTGCVHVNRRRTIDRKQESISSFVLNPEPLTEPTAYWLAYVPCWSQRLSAASCGKFPCYNAMLCVKTGSAIPSLDCVGEFANESP